MVLFIWILNSVSTISQKNPFFHFSERIFFKKSHHVFPQEMMDHDSNEEILCGRRLPVHEEDEVRGPEDVDLVDLRGSSHDLWIVG